MRNKKIVDSWDKIKVNDYTHERILNNILEQSRSNKTRKVNNMNTKPIWKILAPIAACAVIALVIVAVNFIPSGGTQPGTVAQGENLNLNTMSQGLFGAQPPLPGSFFSDVTAEQLQALLPDLGFPVVATATYRNDGSLFEVTAVDNSDNIALWPASVRISTQPVYFGFIYENYQPVVSYVHGVAVTAGVIEGIGIPEDGIAQYIATFEMDGVFYGVNLFDYAAGDDGLNRLTYIVNAIIQHGAADLDVLYRPIMPELQDDRLSIDEARNDASFGAFIPANIPAEWEFDNAIRFMHQDADSLLAFWNADTYIMRWQVSRPTEFDLLRVVSTDAPEKFDLSLYPIPWADSVPNELFQYVMNPVFLAEELTLDVVNTRLVLTRGCGDSVSGQMNFSVLSGDILICVDVSGMSPEQVYAMIISVL